MKEEAIIFLTKQHVQKTLEQDCSGHDWWHVYRVWKNAQYIAKHEGGDLFITELAALLHDIADWKFHDGDLNKGPELASIWLRTLSVEPKKIATVAEIIHQVSFLGASVADKASSLEGEIVRDADRLDALGAIGIARTFAYGGANGRLLYDPNIQPEPHQSVSAYAKNKSPSINHFYEKLLLLKDRMKTETGRKLAENKHRFMEIYLKQFFEECEIG